MKKVEIIADVESDKDIEWLYESLRKLQKINGLKVRRIEMHDFLQDKIEDLEERIRDNDNIFQERLEEEIDYISEVNLDLKEKINSLECKVKDLEARIDNEKKENN